MATAVVGACVCGGGREVEVRFGKNVAGACVCGGGGGREGGEVKVWQKVLLVLVCGGGGREVEVRFGKQCCWCLCV